MFELAGLGWELVSDARLCVVIKSPSALGGEIRIFGFGALDHPLAAIERHADIPMVAATALIQLQLFVDSDCSNAVAHDRMF